MLWIEKSGFAGRNTEESRIKLVDVLDEAASPDVHLAGGGGVAIEQFGEIEPLFGKLGNGIAPFRQEPPKLFRRVRVSGQAAADANNRDFGRRRGAMHRTFEPAVRKDIIPPCGVKPFDRGPFQAPRPVAQTFACRRKVERSPKLAK